MTIPSSRRFYIEPKIVCFDLEIIPDLRKALKYWPKLHSPFKNKTLSASVTSICCFGWKILGEPEVHCINAWDFPSWQSDVNEDLPLIEEALKVLNSADQIITHNGTNFDKKYFQTRLAIKKQQLLRDDPHSDTKILSARNFYFIDNKLDTLTKELGLEEKMDHGLGWELWERTHERDPEAMKIMEEYCKKDVVALESLYRKFRPLDKRAVNFNLWVDPGKLACPKCGSTLLSSDGYRTTTTMRYKRMRCQSCYSPLRLDARDQNPRAI